jgi:hypothetical protein
MSRIRRLICYNLVVLDVTFYFLFQYFHKSPVVVTFIFLFLRMVLFSCSEALVGSQRAFVLLRNVACVQSLWPLSWKEGTTQPRSSRPCFFSLLIEVGATASVEGGETVSTLHPL